LALPPQDGAPSKKEQVLQLAQEDPFLRVEEIARRVGTTAPYVRTILSEGRISLGRLRKSYARAMERRLKGTDNSVPEQSTVGTLDAFDVRLAHLGPPQFCEVDAYDAKRLANEWNLSGGPSFSCMSRWQQTDDGVECLHRVITSLEIVVGPGGAHTDRRLGGYLRLEPDVQVGCGKMTIEIEPADALVSHALQIGMSAPVMSVRRGLVVDGEVVALEEFVFRMGDIRLVVGNDSVGIEPRRSVAEDLAFGGG